MTWYDFILGFITSVPSRSFDSLSIRTATGINRSSFYRVMNKLEQFGIIQVDRSGRYNKYTVIGLYRKFRYTLRIVETHKPKKRNTWGSKGEDVEATVEGYAPINMSADQIRALQRDKLYYSMRNVLTTKSPPVLAIPERFISVEDMESRGISGVEFGEIVNTYKKDFDVEVKFTNSQGKIYNRYDGFDDKYQTSLEEWK